MIYRFNSPDIGDGDVEALADTDSFVGFRSDVERDNPLVRQDDIESADIGTANRMASEAIRVAGAAVEVFLRTNNADFDRVWDEDPDPTYWPPVQMKGFFAPESLQIALKVWGADVPVKLELFFAFADIASKFGGRALRSGDVVKVPFNAIGNARPRLFRIITASPERNYRYTWIYYKCTMESLTGDITVQPLPVDTVAAISIGDQESE